MKITLPFVYAAEVVVGRKKNPAKTMFSKTVVADMPVVTDEEAPVVAVWNSSNTADRPQHARYYDGSFMVPATKLQRDKDSFGIENIAGNGKFDGDTFGFDLSNLMGYPLATDEWHAVSKLLGKRPEKQPEPSDIKQTVSSDEEKRRAIAEDVAESLVCVDGVVYRRVEEPVLVVSNHLWRDKPQVTLGVGFGKRRLGQPIDLDEGIAVGDPLNTRFFPLSEIAVAEEAAESFGLPVERQIDGDPAILVSSVFGFDRDAEIGVRTVEYTIEALKPGIARFDKPTIEAWLSVREPFDVWKRTGDMAIVEGLVAGAVGEVSQRVSTLEPLISAAIDKGLDDLEDATISVSFGASHLRP